MRPWAAMASSDNSLAFQRKDLYLRLEHLIKINDIYAVKKHTQDENLTHVDFVQSSEKELWESREYFSPSYPIIAAAKKGNVDFVNYFISIGFHKNHIWQETTPLIAACYSGHLHVVRELVEIHDVNVNSGIGEAYTNYVDSDDYVVDSDDSFDLEDYGYVGFPNSMKYFYDNSFKNPLIEAIEGQCPEIVNYLLTNGASTAYLLDHIRFIYDDYAYCGQEFSVERIQIIILLEPYLDINVNVPTYHNCETALSSAAAHSSVEDVEALLNAGAHVDGNYRAKRSPFYYALYCGKIENARLLYSRGANPNAINQWRENYRLEFVLESVKYEVIHYLVVELNLPWDDQKMSLELSVKLDGVKTSAIKLLADSGLIYNGSVPMVPYWSRGEVKTETDMILEHLSSNPRTLKEIICFKVRRLLARNLSRVVDYLPLPRPLIDFVKLTHIPCHETGHDDSI